LAKIVGPFGKFALGISTVKLERDAASQGRPRGLDAWFEANAYAFLA